MEKNINIEKNEKLFEKICRLSPRQVLYFMANVLKEDYLKVVSNEFYVYAVGDLPVALVAHADTVFKESDKDYFIYDPEKQIVMNPYGLGADDRAGILAILYIIRKTKFRPTIIITTGEEIGCVGAERLVKDIPNHYGTINFMIELDRQGCNDAVYYDCDNPKFESYINAYGFDTEPGSFTDISQLAPAWKCAAVNLSIGYYDEHTYYERLEFKAWRQTIKKVCMILKDQEKNPRQFEYIPRKLLAQNSYIYESDPNTGWCTKYSEPLGPGYCECDSCHSYIADIDTIPLVKNGKTVSYCLDCYTKVINNIAWCSKCHRGYIFKAKVMPQDNWICRECSDGLQKDSK